jgi:predicted ATPase/class 3 adenylate cyclase
MLGRRTGGQHLAEHRIRGTFEVVSNGASLQLGPPTQRALRAILPLNANRIASIGRLIGLIRGDHAPRSVARAVQICVSELRRILSPFRTPDSFDVLGARQVVDVQVGAPRRGGEMGGSWHRGRSGGLAVVEQGAPARGAADSWHPRTFLLTDIVDSVSLWERDPVAMAQAVEWHDTAIQDAVDAAGGQILRTKSEGDSTFSVFERPVDALAGAAGIQEAVTGEPWPSMMAVRVRVGVHTGDAEPRDGDWYGPAVNRTARLRDLADGGQTLVSGVTAGLVADRMPKAVRLLYLGRRVLRGIERPEEVWELVPADDPRTVTPIWVRVGDLPVARTRFVGRTQDLYGLAELIQSDHLVTLTGSGGSGKTRLALEVAKWARRRGVRVWLAELAPLRDPALVAQAVAKAIGLETGPDPLEELLARADTLAGLLVLDNCEHLLDACAALTERLLVAACDVGVLATSREPLRLTGEREWPVRSLEVPDESPRDLARLARVESVELLLDRARAVRPDLVVGQDDVAPVVQICRALDGVPLAIELAASRLRSLGFADLAARLGDQLATLARPPSACRDDARHRSLRMTLDWSYELLTDEQRKVAQRLSVFAGGFRLDAAEAVCESDLDVLDSVDELVVKSLLSFDATTARYRLLEPLRQYLAERLAASGTAEVARRAHGEWTASLCRHLGFGLLQDLRARSTRLREEAANVEVALQWALENGEHEIALRIVGSLGQYWFFNDNAAGNRWCAAVIEASTSAPPRRRAPALVSAGMVAQNDQAWDRSLAWLHEALAIYRAEQVAPGQAAALFWLGRAHGDPAEAKRCFGESLELSMQLGESVGASMCRVFISVLAAREGALDEAVRLAEQVVEECCASGVDYPVGQALVLLASIAHRRGQDDAARTFLHDAVTHSRAVDDRRQLAAVLMDLAAQEASMGRGAEALEALAESTQLDERIGRLPSRSYHLAVAALAHLARDEPVLAISALGGYDAHPSEVAMPPFGRIGGHVNWLDPAAMAAMRARLDADAVAAAAAAARARSLDGLIDELIIHPAESAK